MTAVEALRALATIVARHHGMALDELLRIEHPTVRVARTRDRLCLIARDLTGCSHGLAGEAFGMSPDSIINARRRQTRNQEQEPATAAATKLLVQTIARNETFLAMLRKAVDREEAVRRARAGRLRGDGLYRASFRPEFQARQRAALQRYFANGGSQALADRNRARAAARRQAGAA